MRKITKFIISMSGVCFSLLSFSVLGSNYSFLNDTASSYFTQEDWRIFNNTQRMALNSGRAGVKIQWRNPQSGSYGYMVPGTTTRENGMVCRTLTYSNTANLIKGGGRYKFCKSHNQWMIY